MTDLRYPIGEFVPDSNRTAEKVARWIDEIADAPARLREAVTGLDEAQLETPYRDGGWTVRQVAHHLPDSHLNAYIRVKLALTEENPIIRPYQEGLWAELPDARTGPVATSLMLLESLHDRWVMLLRSLDEEDFERKLFHPEVGELTIGGLADLYAWHGKHHVAQINALRRRMGW